MRVAAALLATLVAGTVACASTHFDNKTGLLSVTPGAHGGLVMTPNGVEFHDSNDIPKRVVFHDVDEPWRAPIGFILPKSGHFTETSTPTTIASQGIAIVLRPSDTRVPSWGGEILLRVDVHATAAPGTTREGEHVAIIVDGDDDETRAVLGAALGQLGARDVVCVIDTHGAKEVVPPVPATHRALVLAATAQRTPGSAKRDLAGAVARAASAVGTKGTRKILMLSPALQASALPGITFERVDPHEPNAAATVQTFLPPAGAITFRDVSITFDGSPSPSRVLESTSGDPLWTLDGSELDFGDLHGGEARSDVLRVTVPAWVTKTRFDLHVTVRATDAATGKLRQFSADLHAVYDDDLERIAESRHGDVIAYASALATLHRLHAAFVGDAVKAHGGLVALAQMQAQSLALLARDFPDRGFAEDAVVLQTILGAASP